MQPSYEATGTHAWDMKHLVRVIVTSRAYRRTSVASAAAQADDPDNRRIARQRPLRLQAESIRDQALMFGGLLSERVGGRSVFPVQPDGYWASLNYPEREYAASRGEDQHRRSLYTHWQRTFLHPSLLIFDAATREECSAQRSVSNTPLQSLTLLNDPIFLEAARGLAERVAGPGAAPEPQIVECFLRATARRPTAAEMAVLIALYREQLSVFHTKPADAVRFMTVGDRPPDAATPERAAMMTVARAILNLHETITRD